MPPSVTVERLLEGAWYSLEQAGRLLAASVAVFERGDHSTALGIAMFGREELGRSRILRELADEVAGGVLMSPADVQARCEDHEEKQRAAAFTSTMRADRGTKLGDAIMTLMREPRTSEAWRAANEIIETATDAKIGRTPEDRARLREKSLYVDISPSGLSWNRPVEISPTEARAAIDDAVSDYAQERDRRINFPEDDPLMTEAFGTMTPAPDLPYVVSVGLWQKDPAR